jgi:pentose-5-phosphate-3-epimerase
VWVLRRKQASTAVHHHAQAAAAGANVIVAGTAIFKSPDPRQTIQELRQAVASA